MDWQNSMNYALDYIEKNLTNEIDYTIVSKIMNCSECEFRRLFSFIAQIPLSEYIRRRKLTMAAADIQNGSKIIDVAFQYGYKSQAAFTRAFSQLYGVPPSRTKGASLKLYPRLTVKLILMEGMNMEKNTDKRTNIIGAGEVGYAVSAELNESSIHQTNSQFWDTLGNEIIGTTALPFYGAFVTEDKCRLLGEISGKRVLEICCGRGHSLAYIGKQQPAELWGTDISQNQIQISQEYLNSCGLKAKLICAPMEEECGLPLNYFDLIYSIYGIGWTTDLEGTFTRIASYLKKDGAFIFSWSHPIHKCVAAEEDMLVFKKSYFDESWYTVSVGGGSLSLADRKLSTYVNALIKAGFAIEQLVEESEEDRFQSDAFSAKAKMLPVTFVIKARKL